MHKFVILTMLSPPTADDVRSPAEAISHWAVVSPRHYGNPNAPIAAAVRLFQRRLKWLNEQGILYHIESHILEVTDESLSLIKHWDAEALKFGKLMSEDGWRVVQHCLYVYDDQDAVLLRLAVS